MKRSERDIFRGKRPSRFEKHFGNNSRANNLILLIVKVKTVYKIWNILKFIFTGSAPGYWAKSVVVGMLLVRTAE